MVFYLRKVRMYEKDSLMFTRYRTFQVNPKKDFFKL